ncbi:MAG: TlpA family protein disulfide reductase, partial [Longimicrobiales bacterium]
GTTGRGRGGSAMNRRKAALAAVVALPLIGLLYSGLEGDPRAIPSPLPGRAAPPFALEVMPLTGAAASAADSIRLGSLRGDVVVVNFWASWCLPCRFEHPAFLAVARRYADRPVRFLGVLYQDRPDQARAFLEEMGGAAYPTLLDPGARTAIDYGLTGVPETFIIGPDGVIASKIFGQATEAALIERIEPLLAGPGS